jgi:quercetin dioxygenase-like cupin family protein
MRLLATVGDTGEVCTTFEYTLPAGAQGPQPHYHRNTTEAFYVLKGKLNFLMEDQWIVLEPGSFLSVTPGTTHAFRNGGEEGVVFLGFATPGGHERFLEQLVALARQESAGPCDTFCVPDAMPVGVA